MTDLGLTEDDILEEIGRLAQRKRDGPVSSLKYFTPPMERLAGNLAEARSKPITAQPPTQTNGVRSHDKRSERQRASEALDETIRRTASGSIDLGDGRFDPFG